MSEHSELRNTGMIEAVIFDMDGVLVDSEPLHRRAEREVVRELGFSIPTEEHNAFARTTDKFMWGNLKERFQLPQSLDDITRLKQLTYRSMAQGNLHPMTGVLELVPRLALRYPLAVASSAVMDEIDLTVDSLGIRPYFRVFVSGRDVPNSKPAPDIFLEAARRLGKQPSACLVFEDALTGATAAKRAGMRVVAVPHALTQHFDFSAVADYRIPNLTYFDEKFLE